MSAETGKKESARKTTRREGHIRTFSTHTGRENTRKRISTMNKERSFEQEEKKSTSINPTPTWDLEDDVHDEVRTKKKSD